MDFSLSNISWAHLFENGQNFINFSFMGMLIVFSGLSVISIYIVLLPKILNLPKLLKSKKQAKKEKKAVGSLPAQDSELLLAITVALHLDQAGTGNYEKITWKRHEDRQSSWLTAGRMRGLAVRSHLPDRRS
jgi:Na+-transporting methylmalonyl-CoA/oxaloacetate decarboxylase gamma subunit